MAGTNGIQAVFFDAGFTLLKPVRSVAEIYLQGVKRLGVELDHEVFTAHLADCWQGHSRTRGRAADLSSSDHEEHHGWHVFTSAVAAPFPQLARRHGEWLGDLIRTFDDPATWTPYEDVPELLGELRQRGYVLGIISNWHTVLHDILAAHELAARFDFVLVSAEFGWRKPHEAIFREALRLAGVRAGQTLHVGDSLTDDVHGADALGIRPVMISKQAPPEGLPERALMISRTSHVLRLLD